MNNNLVYIETGRIEVNGSAVIFERDLNGDLAVTEIIYGDLTVDELIEVAAIMKSLEAKATP